MTDIQLDWKCVALCVLAFSLITVIHLYVSLARIVHGVSVFSWANVYMTCRGSGKTGHAESGENRPL